MAENYLDILAETIRNNWDQPALTDFYLTEDGTAQDTSRGNHYTYGEMYAELCCVAELLTSLGLQRGDHIAICGANSAHWVIAYLAIAKMQGVSVTIMHSLQPEQIAQMVDFSDAKALFVDRELWNDLYRPIKGDLSSVITLDDWSILRRKEISISNPRPPISKQDCQFLPQEPDNLAMICFTSGSTGGAKGVMLSYRNLDSNIKIFNAIPLSVPRWNIVGALPFSHNFGLFTDFLATICYGEHLFMPQCALNVDFYTKTCCCVQPSYVEIVPAILKEAVSVSIKANKNIKTVLQTLFGARFRGIVVGGSEFPISMEQTLREYKVNYLIGYGATECGIFITYYTSEYHLIKSGSVGKIVEGMTCRISPSGEILVKGENVMLGYYKAPEATAQKIDKDGWLHTGDKGHLDEDGYLYVEGRLEQDMIVLPNGENIHPDHIESLINALPEVSESIVLARDGKLVAIVVAEITNDQSPITNSDLRRMVLRNVNPQLPLYSQLYDVEITDTPLAKTEKQTIKRYLYK